MFYNARYEWDCGPRGVEAGFLEAGVVKHWAKWHAEQALQQPLPMFHGLKVAVYGSFDQKGALGRIISAGGGQVVCASPPR